MSLLIWIIVIVVIVYIVYEYRDDIKNKICDTNKVNEGFRVNSQNYVYGNKFGIADSLDYTEKPMPNLFLKKEQVTGPSDNTGTDTISDTNVMDNRGFKWTTNAKDSEIDEITREIDDANLRNEFSRMYMLDPTGVLDKYDISKARVSPKCCPAQYSPPFPLENGDSSNCDFAQKYVANNYSGMNYEDGGPSCSCVDIAMADFYGARGTNTN